MAARKQSICIIGSGPAGLITAYTLLKDGFSNIHIISRDGNPGGVWSVDKVYNGLFINNVHGEFRFSSLPMPPRSDEKETGGRLSGNDICMYLKAFVDTFLNGKITIVYETEVINIRRPVGFTRDVNGDANWVVTTLGNYGDRREWMFKRVVLCTGGCSEPSMPSILTHSAAPSFTGPIIHSSEFKARLHDLLSAVKPGTSERVVIIGGGRSAQDIAAYLANAGRKVSVVFENTDGFLATPIPLPYWIRKSPFTAIISSYSTLRTRLERFCHTTWLGSKIVHAIWNIFSWIAYWSFRVPKTSPLRKSHPIFWSIRLNDEGVGRPNNFHNLVNAGKIDLIAPNKAVGYADVEHPETVTVNLKDGRSIEAHAIVLATGYKSSWQNLFDDQTLSELGLGRSTVRSGADYTREWDYQSLVNQPSHPDEAKLTSSKCHDGWIPSANLERIHQNECSSSIYRGIVPAKNIHMRDFAINGAVFTTNIGYVSELTSHWISSYFLSDPFLKLPLSVDEALEHTERANAWMRKRYPGMLKWVNESYSSSIVMWNWPQYTDDLLEDLGLRYMRSGGNWLTWPFKVIDLKEIESLGEERRRKREDVKV